jgi:hypothetical protein
MPLSMIREAILSSSQLATYDNSKRLLLTGHGGCCFDKRLASKETKLSTVDSKTASHTPDV